MAVIFLRKCFGTQSFDIYWEIMSGEHIFLLQNITLIDVRKIQLTFGTLKTFKFTVNITLDFKQKYQKKGIVILHQ